MSYLGDNERRRLQRVQLPGNYAACVDVVRDYLGRTGLSASEFAERVGRGRSTVNLFIQGKWDKHRAVKGWQYLAAQLVEFIHRNPIEPQTHTSGRLFTTENYRRIRSYVLPAVERGDVCLLYGPPGTQKSFVLEHLVAERNRQGHNDALLVYASEEIAPLPLLKRIGRAAGVLVGWSQRDHILDNILYAFRSQKKPPAVIVDEAQHLPKNSLEILRELHDRSGCGLVLAGSHNLFENFLRGRQHLEQWLSRIDHKDPLPGLLPDEVREIAARELGNGQPAKLSEKQVKAILEACAVDDVFARGQDGRVKPCKYFSVRRLVKFLDQVKESARQRAKASHEGLREASLITRIEGEKEAWQQKSLG